MIPIKFRGRAINGGYYVWGDGLLQLNGKIYIVTQAGRRECKRGSVKLLAGYDKNGTELYEDDYVADEFGNESRVCLWHIDFSRLELKP